MRGAWAEINPNITERLINPENNNTLKLNLWVKFPYQKIHSENWYTPPPIEKIKNKKRKEGKKWYFVLVKTLCLAPCTEVYLRG